MSSLGHCCQWASWAEQTQSFCLMWATPISNPGVKPESRAGCQLYFHPGHSGPDPHRGRTHRAAVWWLPHSMAHSFGVLLGSGCEAGAGKYLRNEAAETPIAASALQPHRACLAEPSVEQVWFMFILALAQVWPSCGPAVALLWF